MLENIPSAEVLKALLGSEKFELFHGICSLIDELYEMDTAWNKGYKAWKYEYKYRRGGKTLCALYMRENCLGIMFVFGRDERAKFEAGSGSYSSYVSDEYSSATTYHDGKWLMLEPKDDSIFSDIKKLLMIKRKPNRKLS